MLWKTLWIKPGWSSTGPSTGWGPPGWRPVGAQPRRPVIPSPWAPRRAARPAPTAVVPSVHAPYEPDEYSLDDGSGSQHEGGAGQPAGPARTRVRGRGGDRTTPGPAARRVSRAHPQTSPPQAGRSDKDGTVRFRVERDVLAEVVAWAARTLPSRPPVPVLAGVLVEAGEGSLTLSSFDYEVSARCTAEAVVERAGVGARLRPAARRDRPQPAGPPGDRDHRRGRPQGRGRLRLARASPCRRCRSRSTPRCPTCRPPPARSTAPRSPPPSSRSPLAAGRDDTLPVLTGVRIELDRRDHDAGRHRPLPAGGPRARLAAGQPLGRGGRPGARHAPCATRPRRSPTATRSRWRWPPAPSARA